MEPPSPPIRKTRVTYNEPGHAHELTFSCHKRMPLLNGDRTRWWFIEALDAARKRFEFDLWAYVIMPEHVHALIFPKRRDYDISKILSAIKTPVSRQAVAWLRKNNPNWLNRLKVQRPSGRVEYRLQGGGYDRNIIKTDTAWKSVKYIHENPVRRGLVKVAVDWPWSSARSYAGIGEVLLQVDGCPHR